MLLLKNSFISLKENKAKTIGIIALVFLACFLFSLFSNSISVLEQSNDTYFTKQNVYDFTILPNMTEEENASENIEEIYEQKLDKLAEDNDFYYEIQKTALYEFEKDDKEYIFLLIVPQIGINKPYLVEGSLPKNDNEVTVSDQYAKSNNLKIGDDFAIDGTKFIIVGFAYQPDFVYPVMDEESPDVVPSEQSVVFVTDKTMNQLDVEIRYNYSARFNDNIYNYNRVMDLRDAIKSDTQYINSRDNKINRSRTMFLYEQMKTLSIFSVCFLIFLFLIIIFALTVILRKKVEADKSKLGQLKAIGYSNFEIATSYISLAALSSTIGGVFGFVGGYFGAQWVVAILTSSILELPTSAPLFRYSGLAASVLIPFVLFSFVSYIIALFIMKKPTLELIYENRSENLNMLSKKVAVLCKNRSFQTQFKFGLVTNSPLRLIGVFLIMLAIGVMLNVSLIVSDMVKSNVDAKVNQVEYAYEVGFDEYVDIADIQTDVYFEPSLNMRLYAKEGITAKGQIVSYDALNNNEDALNDFYVDVLALLPDSHLLKIHDIEQGELINGKLKGDEIGISAVVAQVLGVGVGDRIVFYDSDNTEKMYKVVAISENYDQSDIYVALDTIQNDFGHTGQVNIIYTDGKYNDEELDYVAVGGSEEIDSFKQAAILSTILTIIFALILTLVSFIVLLILANIIIDENRKSITLLRVFGYDQKEISYMVVDIYTPIIVITYIAALPIAIFVCQQFTNIMAESVYSSYPVGISPLLFLVGGLCLFCSYKIAIRATRKNVKSAEWKRDVY